MVAKRFFVLLIIFIFLGLRFYFYFTKPNPFNDGDRIRITTSVRSEPVKYENSQYLRLKGLKVYLPLYPEIIYGDKVVVEGVVDAAGPKGLWPRGEYKLKNPKLVSLKESKGLTYKFRNKLLDFYSSRLPKPHSSLIAGVAIGSKSGLPQDFWEILKNSGTAHVVVASGMNITLVGGFLLNFFILFMKRKSALVAALVGIWFYAILSGFDAPIVRAGIMGTIAFSAQVLGRVNFALRALLISGILMLLLNPGYIIDAGFLLSFFATLGLILFENNIRKRLTGVPPVIREDLSTTLAAQFGVVPLLYYFFGQFNVLSPIVNVLVLWTIVPITVLGMIAGIIGLIVPIVGTAVLYLTYPLTLWFVNIVQFFGK